MDRAAALPDRCVICNQPAENRRIKRTLYWTPRAWRLSAPAVLLGCFVVGMTKIPPLLELFGWLVLLAIVVHLVLRKSLKLQLPICAVHRRGRDILRAVSVAGMVVLLGSFFIVRETFTLAIALMMISAATLLVLGTLQSFVGIYAVGLHDVSKEHAWLSGAGRAFRDTLPELN